MSRLNINIYKPKTVIFSADSMGVARIYYEEQLFAEKPFMASEFRYNLPFSGNYVIQSETGLRIKEVKPLEKVVKDIVLPIQDRDKTPIVRKIFRDNSRPMTPARIFSDHGVIALSKSFYTYPIEVRIFILLHEVGHFHYRDEYKCDTFAAWHFLDWGCNPSQAFESLAGVLHPSKQNDHRIENIYKLLSKH